MSCRLRAAAPLLLALLVLSAPGPARAGEHLDVQEWLRRPGVRLLAVEFYATWCKPCMAAVPHWKKLHERYRNRGLRLVVVNTLDPDGGCVNPGWSPNDIVCDDQGLVAGQMGVGSRLPAAFLWSWQGNLLVRRGHVDEVDRAIREYLKQTPRLALEVGAAPDAALLEDLVRAQITESGKLEVVAGAAERKLLDQIRRRSKDPAFDDQLGCELGREVPANSLLKASVRASRLSLTLHSAETGCVLTSVSVPWDAARPRVAVAEAADELLSRLRRPTLELPGRAAAPDAPPEADRGVGTLWLRSDQPGVAYRVEGTDHRGTLPAGRATSVELPLTPAPYRVVLSKQGFEPHEARLLLDRAHPVATLDHSLTPIVQRTSSSGRGWLVVKSSPENAEVFVDGVRQTSRTPATLDLPAGRHAIRLSRKSYRDWTGEVDLPPDGSKTVDQTLTPDFGTLEIEVHPPEAAILLNRTRVGAGRYRDAHQKTGGYAVRLTAPLHAPVETTVYVEPGATVRLSRRLTPRYGALTLEVRTRLDDRSDALPRVFLDGAPVDASLRPRGEAFAGRLERVPSGAHEVEIQLPRFDPHVASVTVRDGETVGLEATLTARFGVLAVTSEPAGAVVEVDGRDAGRTPVELLADAGNHAVVIRHADPRYRPTRHDVVVRAEQRATVRAELEVVHGSLAVGTNPPDAEIYLDGELRGRAPVQLRDIPVGRHRIEARLRGWTPTTVEVEVLEGETARTLVELGQLGAIEATCLGAAPGVTVAVDGHEVVAAVHRFEGLSTGGHEVVCTSPAGHTARQTADAAPGRLTTVELDLTDPAVVLEAWESSKSDHQVWGGVLLGVAGAAAVVGAVTLGLAFEQDAAKETAYQRFLLSMDQATGDAHAAAVLAAQDERDALAVASGVSFGLAGAAAVAGVVACLLVPERPEATESAWRVEPALGAGAAGVSLRGGF